MENKKKAPAITTEGISGLVKRCANILIFSVLCNIYTFLKNENKMSKYTLPLTECCTCAKLESCPMPSDEPDMRLCYVARKEDDKWDEKD